MAGPAEQHDAIVLRTLRYGDSDLIAHLFTRGHGRINAMAKGARRPRSRLGARLDPFLVTRVMLRAGKGDLAHVQGVEVTTPHDRLRTRYAGQRAAAGALDMLGRLNVEHHGNEPAFHLTCHLLHALDAPTEPDTAHLLALSASFELKLLHLTGLAPQLASCVRCGSSARLAFLSASDGGVICRTCSAVSDRPVEAGVLEAAAWAMRTSLAEVAGAAALPDGPLLRTVRADLVAAMCREHAGFAPKA